MKNYILLIGTLVAAILLVAGLHLLAPTPIQGDEGVYSSFLAAQANHYSLLQIYLVTFSLGIAVAAFFGYEGIKRAISNKVETRLHEVMPGAIRQQLKGLRAEEVSRVSINDKMSQSVENGPNNALTDIVEGDRK